MLFVYKAMPDPKRVGFGPRIECVTWRQANEARKKIASDALAAKDGSYPVTYDELGRLVGEGWQK